MVYFIVFILIGSVICINLFIAIISMNFAIAQRKDHDSKLTDE